MNVGIDLGASTIDVVAMEKNRIAAIVTTKYDRVVNLNSHAKRLRIKSIDNIYITGGKSGFHNTKILKIIPIKINEINAIGRGGLFLAKKKKALVVSCGTGTCMVDAGKKFRHIGGSGVGGGTLVGLSSIFLQNDSLKKIRSSASRGHNHKVDITVGDIIGSSIGMIPAKATAANFGKGKGSSNDRVNALCAMIGQTIATVAIFAARSVKQKDIILTGKLLNVKEVRDALMDTGKLYRQKFLIPKHYEYATAIGAALGE
jgi:type II pantothenate kinase